MTGSKSGLLWKKAVSLFGHSDKGKSGNGKGFSNFLKLRVLLEKTVRLLSRLAPSCEVVGFIFLGNLTWRRAEEEEEEENLCCHHHGGLTGPSKSLPKKAVGVLVRQ